MNCSTTIRTVLGFVGIFILAGVVGSIEVSQTFNSLEFGIYSVIGLVLFVQFVLLF